MSKQHYIVNCYTCQHNGQETCKGCRTFLVGDDEPYENWQLREDLETKDQKIADLEAKLELYEQSNKVLNNQLNKSTDHICELNDKLAEKDLRIEELESQFAYECECNKQFVECQKENDKLKQQLAEEEKEIETLNKFLSDKADEIEKITCDYKRQLSASNILTQAMKIREHNQDKISFAVEQLNRLKEDENLYDMMFEYLNNQGVKIKGIDYWCLLDIPDDIKNNSIEFEQQFKEVYKSMFDCYVDDIVCELTHQHEDK